MRFQRTEAFDLIVKLGQHSDMARSVKKAYSKSIIINRLWDNYHVYLVICSQLFCKIKTKKERMKE